MFQVRVVFRKISNIKKLLILTLVLSINVIPSKAFVVKRTIQVVFTGAIPTMSFHYYDSAFIQNFIRFSNPGLKDTIISQDVNLYEGQVLKFSMGLKDGKISVKSFIVPSSMDTLKFEIDADYNLHAMGGTGYFIEDAIDILYADPRQYRQIDDAFMDKDTGKQLINDIFKSNTAAISQRYDKALCSKIEYDVLSTIAKTDYYTRLLCWAQKNNNYAQIESEMTSLAEEKERIQSVSSSAIVQFFGNYVGYLIYRDRLKDSHTNQMVNAVIGLGWHKNITVEYIINVLEDISIDLIVATKCYEDLKKYLNGEYEAKLVRIARSILPKLVDTDQAVLSTIEGKQLNFKDLLHNNAGKLLLIDFWASWCLPCREEAPFFESNKLDFAGKRVVFISISLDEDDKVVNWKKALKEEGLLNATNHYRLNMPTNNPVFKNFGVSNIPRYILINSKGEFIHPNFYMPSDPKFKESLAKIIAAEN